MQEAAEQTREAIGHRENGRGRSAKVAWLRRSLACRVALFLSLALVPLALLAFEQTRRLEAELDRVRGLNLHAITAEIARREATGIARASGMARSMAATLPILIESGAGEAACIAAARQVIARSGGDLTFVGYLPPDGIMRCSSTGETRDLSAVPEIHDRMAEPQDFVSTSHVGRMSRSPVISVHAPAHGAEGDFAGYVIVSLSARDIALPGDVTGTDLSVALVTADGEVLGATGDPDAAARRLPARFEPGARSIRAAFVAQDGAGREIDYTVEPIVEGVVYAVGFRPERAAGGVEEWVPPAVLPLLMWLASIALVVGVLESSLIGPVRALGSRMRRFGETRQLSRRPRDAPPLPAELALIEDTFADVAEQMGRDEARLIDAVEEREALLKEVHHRVKNNLQIIASIINLQIRDAEAPETEDALMRVNARIASLATVHRRLYEAESLGRMRFDTLLRHVVSTLTDTAWTDTYNGAGRRDPPAAPHLTFDTEPLRLSPNQALPAAMFAVEALTNALKYATPDATGALWVNVRLAALGGGMVELAVESSGSAPEAGANGRAGRTLGHRLITGFARQLRGRPTIGWEGGCYVASVVFKPLDAGEDRAPLARDGVGTGMRHAYRSGRA